MYNKHFINKHLFLLSLLLTGFVFITPDHANVAVFFTGADANADVNVNMSAYYGNGEPAACPDKSEWMHSATWMHNRSLYEITLPGTHDSGAYALYNSYLRGFVANWIEDAMELAQLLHIDVYHLSLIHI
jgi:hypothetical protein